MEWSTEAISFPKRKQSCPITLSGLEKTSFVSAALWIWTRELFWIFIMAWRAVSWTTQNNVEFFNISKWLGSFSSVAFFTMPDTFTRALPKVFFSCCCVHPFHSFPLPLILSFPFLPLFFRAFFSGLKNVEKNQRNGIEIRLVLDLVRLAAYNPVWKIIGIGNF